MRNLFGALIEQYNEERFEFVKTFRIEDNITLTTDNSGRWKERGPTQTFKVIKIVIAAFSFSDDEVDRFTMDVYHTQNRQKDNRITYTDRGILIGLYNILVEHGFPIVFDQYLEWSELDMQSSHIMNFDIVSHKVWTVPEIEYLGFKLVK